jgi:hypothetical protein
VTRPTEGSSPSISDLQERGDVDGLIRAPERGDARGAEALTAALADKDSGLRATAEIATRGFRGAGRLVLAALAAVLMVSVLFVATGCGNNYDPPIRSQGSGAPQEMYQDRQATPTSEPVKILEIGNVYGIHKGGKAPSFKLDKPATITNLTTYHYIDGETYGPWQATGLDGQGGVKNAFWEAKPMESIPAGKYTVIDSSPGTWSTNAKAGGVGFTTIWVAYE